MKNILSILILVFLLTGSVYALDSLGTYKQNQIINISQICSDATYITISISYPNSTNVIINKNMSSIGSGNFYYDFSNTSQIGRYNVNGISDGCENTFATYFEVTPSGFTGTLGFYALIILLSAGVIVLGFKYQDATLGVLGSFGLYFVGLYTLFFGIDGIKDAVYTWAFGIIVLMIAVYISIRASYELIVD